MMEVFVGLSFKNNVSPHVLSNSVGTVHGREPAQWIVCMVLTLYVIVMCNKATGAGS